MTLALEPGSRQKLGGLRKDTKAEGSEEIATKDLRIRAMSYKLVG